MPLQRTDPILLSILGCILSILFLAVLIWISPSRLCYDEPYHIALADSVETKGLRAALVSPENQSAAGPLYPIIHSAASSITEMDAPAIRWVNFICLILVIGLIALTLKQHVEYSPWIGALTIISVPFLWPAVGLALTEMPALLAFSGFIFCVSTILTNENEESPRELLAWAALAGVALGVSILGRQTYLIILPAVAALCYTSPKNRVLWILCLLTTAMTCGWLFILWGGLVPPIYESVGDGIRIDHGFLSLSYIAAATLFINPRWMKERNAFAITGIFVTAALIAWLTRDYSSPPAKSLLLGLFSEPIALAIGFGIGAFLTGAGLLWLWKTLQALWLERVNPWRSFLLMILLALAAAPVKVSHLFSSRYVIGALGVLILVIVTSMSYRWLSLRIILGSILGGALLWTYYQT